MLTLRRVPVTVSAVYRDDVEVAAARGGENLRLRVAGVDEDDVAGGFVLCSRSKPVPCVTYFDAQLQVQGCLAHVHTTAFGCTWKGLCFAGLAHQGICLVIWA